MLVSGFLTESSQFITVNTNTFIGNKVGQAREGDMMCGVLYKDQLVD